MNASKALGCGAAAVRPNEAAVAERISSRVAASYSGEYPSVFTPGVRMAGSTGNENAVGGAKWDRRHGWIPRSLTRYCCLRIVPLRPPARSPRGSRCSSWMASRRATTQGPFGSKESRAVEFGMRPLLGSVFGDQYGHSSGRRYQSGGGNWLVIAVASFGAIGIVMPRDGACAGFLFEWSCIFETSVASSVPDTRVDQTRVQLREAADSALRLSPRLRRVSWAGL